MILLVVYGTISIQFFFNTSALFATYTILSAIELVRTPRIPRKEPEGDNLENCIGHSTL